MTWTAPSRRSRLHREVATDVDVTAPLQRIIVRAGEINQLIVEIARSAEREAARLQRVNMRVVGINNVLPKRIAYTE
ncbi:hypothetical protein K7957_00830 [Sphingomonas yunnanensis]|uniref:hypothetical protein n=1 Tax=Sphingomonas yunnanensis TaxID=310400 RepID=UPI001CA729EC|nr:hypothetical protein [Sphingomonas yunnanensis]MBY9061476.1 hypothetical protein [Sphingomonas yunnanensis]